MPKAGMEAVVSQLPPCDLHPDRPAGYDFRTQAGFWMFGCERCFRLMGLGLGTGRGQKLIVRKES